MKETFADMLLVGGKANSLGRVNDVIEVVLADQSRLDELYKCLFEEDAWVRMRAADALEKICRVHPDWLLPYIDMLQADFASNTQASIQWHMAQIFAEVELTTKQKEFAIHWLQALLATETTDWIVAANAMDTLGSFTQDGSFPRAQFVKLLHVQLRHKSNAVIRRAHKWLDKVQL